MVTASNTQVDGHRSSVDADVTNGAAGSNDASCRDGHTDRPHLPRDNAFGVRGVDSSNSVRGHSRLDPRHSTRDDGQFPQEEDQFVRTHGTSRPTSQPYSGSRDTRNEAARSDPRRYDAHAPPYRPPAVNVDYGLDEDDEDYLPQGGLIISPRLWDR